MENPIPAELTLRFANPSARPVVVSEYHPSQGWLSPRRKVVLDTEHVEALHLQGVTMVRARWRFRSREFSMSTLRHDRKPTAPLTWA